ncbi:MAG: hypothetical protein AAFZ58_11735, partial [Pseudomonadota bacterium]
MRQQSALLDYLDAHDQTIPKLEELDNVRESAVASVQPDPIVQDNYVVDFDDVLNFRRGFGKPLKMAAAIFEQIGFTVDPDRTPKKLHDRI